MALEDWPAVRLERRFRMLTEVSGLRAMKADGVPLVMDANEGQWREPDADLYLVMEFIEGPTMNELVHKAPPSLDQALACTMRILDILAAGTRFSPLWSRRTKNSTTS